MRRFLFILLTCLCSELPGQHHDFGHWYDFQVSTKLARKLNASAELGNRFLGPGSQLDNTYFEFGLTRKVTDFLRVQAAWRYAARGNDVDGIDLNHRWAFGFRLNQDLGKVDFSWRSVYQFRPDFYFGERGTDLNTTWRNRIRGQIKLMKRTWLSCDLEGFAESGDDRLQLSDWRTRVRVKRKLDKRLYGSVGGLFQRELNTRDPNAEWILTFSIQWEWKRKKKD